MRSPETILVNLNRNSKNVDYKYERLYRLLYNKEFYLMAYGKIYANEGNMTPGTDGETIDGFSLDKIDKLIKTIKDESYQPKPSRREYIPKKNGKKRPLGIPSIYDKLVQEVIRQILEAIYEDSFSDNSHGFRPNKSCHTALKQIKSNCTGTKWWVEGDIKGFFDNIDHKTMIQILRKRIKDEKFLNIVWKFLRAGYLEDFKYNCTYSGTPQGGIISPILSNIYLNEFDTYIEKYINNFNKGDKRKDNKEYKLISERIRARRIKLRKLTDDEKAELNSKLEELLKEREEYRNSQYELGITNVQKDSKYRSISTKIFKVNSKLKEPTKEEREQIINEIQELKKELRKHRTYDQMDKGYKRMRYVRYADDFIIGIIGSKEDAVKVKSDITEFLEKELKIELSQEKTLITHRDNSVRFLGYDIFIDDGFLRKREFHGKAEVARTGVDGIRLSLPFDILQNFMLKNEYIFIKPNGEWKAKHRAKFLNNDPLETLLAYNSEFRGFYNYYKFAFNGRDKLANAHILFKQSFAKTLGNKFKTQISKLRNQYDEHGNKKFFRNGKWGVSWTDKQGKPRWNNLFDYSDMPSHKEIWELDKLIEEVKNDMDTIPNSNMGAGRNSLITRLQANKCEWCGDTEGPFEVHHVKKLKDLKKKKNLKNWEKHMISRNRKTLVLCGNKSKNNCHLKLHNNQL